MAVSFFCNERQCAREGVQMNNGTIIIIIIYYLFLYGILYGTIGTRYIAL